MVTPGLFVGTLRHRRFAPVAHAFTYPLFMVLLDIERLADLMAVSRLTSYNRWNWASFHDADHLPGSGSLRARLAGDARHHGVQLPDGPVYLLTHLRYLGYVFNPVSFFYCFDRHGTVQVVMAETANTFGGTHHYWLPRAAADARSPDSERPPSARDRSGVGSAGEGPDAALHVVADKSLYVSPFMAANLVYEFHLTPPADRLVAHMNVRDEGGRLFDATLSLDRRDWSPREIRRALVRHPLMTGTVIAGIHWQALRLWWKGVPVVPRQTTDGVGERAAVEKATTQE